MSLTPKSAYLSLSLSLSLSLLSVTLRLLLLISLSPRLSSFTAARNGSWMDASPTRSDISRLSEGREHFSGFFGVNGAEISIGFRAAIRLAPLRPGRDLTPNVSNAAAKQNTRVIDPRSRERDATIRGRHANLSAAALLFF